MQCRVKFLILAMVLLLLTFVASLPMTATISSTTTTSRFSTAAASGEAVILSSKDADAIRGVVMAYWKAFNAYDVDKVLSYLEDGWRQQDEDKLRREISQLKKGFLFIKNVKLEVFEESPPARVGDGEAEMMVRLKTPVGFTHDYFRLVKIGDEWKINFSEQR